MAAQHLRKQQHILQRHIRPEDHEWSYYVPNLPSNEHLDKTSFIKLVSLISKNVKKDIRGNPSYELRQAITMGFDKAPVNRVVSSDKPSKLLLISFAEFRLFYPANTEYPEPKPAPARETGDYITRLLRTGLKLNGVDYHFYGHSNSQLKSRSCLMYAGTKAEISRKIESLGDFSKMKSVAKKAKRIGLLFSSADVALVLDPERCEDIADIQNKDYIFTDGCGLISRQLVNQIVQRQKIVYRNVRYTPSVFQIRYRGYKGVLTLDPHMKGNTLVKFRDSMKKFNGGDDWSFAVAAHSRPYTYGNLNDEIIVLINSLGVSTSTLLKKQQQHFNFLENASQDPQAGFRFLAFINKPDLAERLLLDGLDSVRSEIKKSVRAEYAKMLNKRDEQRCRISIPKSRIIFGVCDPADVLKPGECSVRITVDQGGVPMSLANAEILVTRNPTLHPGDSRKLKAVHRPELDHLIDCIVFSTQGKRPSVDMMSGGDLDGDTFFVCWDPDIIPPTMSQPAEYPAGREPIKFEQITDDNRLEYFAKYTNMSLGRVKNLYLDWARVKGPMSPECQQLNRLFSSSVDGNRIRVPGSLEGPPKPDENTPPFVLDLLHQAAKEFIKSCEQNTSQKGELDGYTFDAIQLFLSRDNMAMSEFELIQITYRWCLKNEIALDEFLHFFDFNILSQEEKLWIVNHLPPTLDYPALVMNALLQSSLVSESEIKPFRLHYPSMRWKRIFSSSEHRMGMLFDSLKEALSLFHRKLIFLRVDERLTVAIYIPSRIERTEETQVEDSVRLFAFTHTHDGSNRHRLVVPTKKNYRLYYDSTSFQLYERQRANTFVFINKSQTDRSKIQSVEGRGDRRRARQLSLDDGTNYDWRASIALDKFSKNVQKHVGRVNRNGILGAEIYVISNRDIRGQQLLDLWLEQIDTEETLPLFEKTAREYIIPQLSGVDWSEEDPRIVRVVRERDYSAFERFTSMEDFSKIFEWLWQRDERTILGEIFDSIVSRIMLPTNPFINIITELFELMSDFLRKAPYLAITFTRQGGTLQEPQKSLVETAAPRLLISLVLSVNEIAELTIQPFKRTLARISHMHLQRFAEIVETICLSVNSPELALDLLLGSLEDSSNRIMTDRPRVIQYFVKNLTGVVLEHIDEANESSTKAKYLFNLKQSPLPQNVIASLRIDAPLSDQPRTGDHVRLIAANSPTNLPIKRPYSMSAVVEKSYQGQATFRCLHPPPPFVEECSWKLVNCGSFVTAKITLDAIVAFATEKEEVCGIYGLILDLPGYVDGYITEEQLDEGAGVTRQDLNDSQNEAVSAALSSQLTCLWGPPGTGKTHTIVVILQELRYRFPEERILVTAPTHNAVDNVMQKYLSKQGADGDKDSHPLRVSTDVRRVAEPLKRYTCDAFVGKDISENPEARKKALARVKSSDLVFSTCAGTGLGLLRDERFGIVVIDEASQQTEPTSLIPLVKGCNRAVLVGDHVQLRATVRRHAAIEMFDVSLFERLYSEHSGRGGVRKVMLDTQYRMHRDICGFSSREFYEGKLKTGVKDSDRPLPKSDFTWKTNSGENCRTLFVQTSGPEDIGQKSKSNKAQAEICRVVCKQLQADSSTPKPSIAILTPYSRQMELLKRMCAGVEVSTIDAFQGREADIIIFVSVRCNPKYEMGFLKDMRRLNVALTRAKTGLIIIGDRATLTLGEDIESASLWKRLIDGMGLIEWELPEIEGREGQASV